MSQKNEGTDPVPVPWTREWINERLAVEVDLLKEQATRYPRHEAEMKASVELWQNLLTLLDEGTVTDLQSDLLSLVIMERISEEMDYNLRRAEESAAFLAVSGDWQRVRQFELQQFEARLIKRYVDHLIGTPK